MAQRSGWLTHCIKLNIDGAGEARVRSWATLRGQIALTLELHTKR